MSEPIVEWVGSSCGKHGAYTFYKGFKLTANDESRKYLLGQFYFIRNSKDRPICIAEFQLLWHDANTDTDFASARLYFRPESIPGGRQSCHGKDELFCTDEKVVIKCNDMMNLEYDGTGWSYGIKAISELSLQEIPTPGSNNSEDTKKFRLLKRTSKSKMKKVMPKERSRMVILSFAAYCRFKSIMKKLLSGLILTKMAIKAFGGVIQCTEGTWVSFSRESFHHPGLNKFDMFSHNKAPVLKGRPRKKKVRKTTVSKQEVKHGYVVNTIDRQPSNEAESSDDNQTDTSETSSVGGQELPCPPKLVTAVKEEPVMQLQTSKSVIRSVKQASEFDGKPLAIPPIPRLVKIEPNEPNAVSYGQFRPYSECSGSLMHNNPISVSNIKIEKNIPLKMSHSGSVISTSCFGDDGQTRDSGSRVSYTTQTRKVEKCCPAVNIPISKVNIPTSVPTSLHASLVSHAATITTNHNMQPRMSTIVPTPLATQAEVTKNLGTSELTRPGNETRPEQPLKRKRGRPPGKSSKLLKSSEVKIAPKKATLLAECDEVKMEEVVSGENPECLVENEEYSPEPQNAEEREFMKNLKIFMRQRGSPIDKIPAMGFKKINLFKMYEVAQSLGGYDQVTSKRLWRRVYSEVGDAPSITSAAASSRKNYEKLLLPFERYLRGEDCTLEATESPSPQLDGIVSSNKDQNGNVVSQNEVVVLSTCQQEKLSKPAVSHVMPLNVQTKSSIPAVSRVTGTPARSHAIPLFHQENRLKPVVTGTMSQQNELFKSAVPHAASLSHQSNLFDSSATRVLSSNQQDRHTNHPVVSYLTSVSPQNKPITTTVLPISQQDRTLRPAVARTMEQTHYTKPTITAVSYQSQQDRRSVVSHSNRQHQCNRPADHINDPNSAVEFVTTGNRGSPVLLYSSNSENLRYPANNSFEAQSIRHSARPRVIAVTGTSDTTPDLLRNDKKAYITERSEDYPVMYVPKHEPRTSVAEFERNQKYISRFDHVNDFSRSHDYQSSVSREHDESRDLHKHVRGNGDGILVTNVVPNKMSRTHSPIPRDEGFMFSLPVFQPSHYPHGGFELYDLPNTTFPVRASSRIFMPPHQVYPGTGHATFSPYTPHIIATIGTDPGTLYQLPMSGYYPQELGYPMDTGVQILHS